MAWGSNIFRAFSILRVCLQKRMDLLKRRVDEIINEVDWNQYKVA